MATLALSDRVNVSEPLNDVPPTASRTAQTMVLFVLPVVGAVEFSVTGPAGEVAAFLTTYQAVKFGAPGRCPTIWVTFVPGVGTAVAFQSMFAKKANELSLTVVGDIVMTPPVFDVSSSTSNWDACAPVITSTYRAQ
jgi:hypothetical protein